MAGIGFQLNKILARGSYTSKAEAYAYAGVIGSGSWMVTMISLGLLGLILTGIGDPDDMPVLFISISLIFAVTLVLTGPVQMVLTRYAADQEFYQRTDTTFPAFIQCLSWTALGAAVTGLTIFGIFVPGSWLFRLSAAMSLVLVASTWITGVLLTSIKRYHSVLLAYFLGCTVSLAAAWSLYILLGKDGAMLGVAIGQAVLLLILCGIIFKEMGSSAAAPPGFFSYFVKYWDLALGGLLYNLGIWADKFLYWWCDPGSQQVAGILYSSPIYDRVVCFSFLTIIPGMAVFLLKLETDFAFKHQVYYQHVLRKATLSQLLEHKEGMIEALRNGLVQMLKVQGTFTVILIALQDQVSAILGLGAVQSSVFQISLIGVFFMVFFLALLTVLYYLDKRRLAMYCCLGFTLANTLFTYLAILGGERWFGAGFLVASAAAVLISVFLVNRCLNNLDYDTFASQSIYG